MCFWDHGKLGLFMATPHYLSNHDLIKNWLWGDFWVPFAHFLALKMAQRQPGGQLHNRS
jgi:hypothetical protein